mmetsp:Transcript_5827/g.14937  ORF Transcript_5827/g.14937 Transcript_5827/m.14937 type:complete len:235 (-) Transcript_5827:204-908(-)
MGEVDSTTRLLRQVQGSSHQLLRSCTKLCESLPDAPALPGGEGEWPRLLGHFRNVSAQIADLGGWSDLQQLEHAVAVPTHPAPHPDGRPSMRVPELLRTKRPPEQEAEEAEVRARIAMFMPEESLPKEEREQVAAERLGQMRDCVNQYNKAIDDVVGKFLEGEAFSSADPAVNQALANEPRLRLKRKCADTVTRFLAKRKDKRTQQGVDLLAYLHTGHLQRLARLDPPPPPQGA